MTIEQLTARMKRMEAAHHRHAHVLAALCSASQPFFFQDKPDGMPWCMYCGAEHHDGAGRLLPHHMYCLVPHLKWLSVAYMRLLDQFEWARGTLEHVSYDEEDLWEQVESEQQEPRSVLTYEEWAEQEEDEDDDIESDDDESGEVPW